MKKTLNYMQFALVPVESEVMTVFTSAIAKERFILDHTAFPSTSYEVYKNHAYNYKYYVIDRSGDGFILNRNEPLVYSECIDLIKHYL